MAHKQSLILAGLLIDGTGAVPAKGKSLVVEDGRIADIRATHKTLKGIPTLDYRDQVIMPGLIDTHVHLELTPGPDHESGIRSHGVDAAAGLTQLRALGHAQRALIGGVTTIQDCGSSIGILGVKRAINMGMPGPRLLVSGPPITTTAGHGYWVGARADDEVEVRKATRKLIEEGVDVIKIVASGGNATAGTNPLQPQYTTAELRAAVDEAHRLGRRVVAHALNSESIHRCVDAGIDVIDHCWWNASDGSPAYDQALADRMVSAGTTAGMTGSGILRILLDRGSRGAAELRRRLSIHKKMFDLGIPVTVHSDAGGRFTYFERFDDSLKVMVTGMKVRPMDAIQAATKHAAASLGLSAELGTIEPRKRADLLVLDKDPLGDIGNLRAIRSVIRDGRVVVDQGRIWPDWRSGSDPATTF